MGRNNFSIRWLKKIEKEMIEKNWEKNVTVAVNVLFVKKEKIYPAYVSKHNSNGKSKLLF